MIKKSNVLMLSYIFFLISAVFAAVVYEWSGIHQISLAATIAGCFFAIADLSNWYISYQKVFIERSQEQLSALRVYGEKLIEKSLMQQRDLKNVIEMLSPYRENDCTIISLLATCERGISQYKQNEDEMRCSMNEIDEIEQKNSTKLNAVTVVKYIEIVASTIGFFAFFSLLAFDAINDFFATFGSNATVIAFAIIMLTYFLKDFFEEKEKEKVEKVKRFIEKCNKGVADTEEKMKQHNYTEKAKELLDILKKEKENG